jgi:hypothetical protein
MDQPPKPERKAPGGFCKFGFIILRPCRFVYSGALLERRQHEEAAKLPAETIYAIITSATGFDAFRTGLFLDCCAYAGKKGAVSADVKMYRLSDRRCAEVAFDSCFGKGKTE